MYFRLKWCPGKSNLGVRLKNICELTHVGDELMRAAPKLLIPQLENQDSPNFNELELLEKDEVLKMIDEIYNVNKNG